MKDCEHNWVGVKVSNGTHRDECSKCGCLGRLADKPDENGFWQIVAVPMGNVIDLQTFRNRKGKQNENSSSN